MYKTVPAAVVASAISASPGTNKKSAALPAPAAIDVAKLGRLWGIRVVA